MTMNVTQQTRASTLQIKSFKGQASFQDLGRTKALHLGFGTSGAADEYAYLAANTLVGNAKPFENELCCAALELLMANITLIAHCNCIVAITGANAALTVNNQPAPLWQAIMLSAGDELSIKISTTGLYNYLAVKGGFDSTIWQGSRSQLVTMAHEFHFNKPLVTGDLLPLNVSRADLHVTGNNINFNGHHFYDTKPLYLRFIPSVFWCSLTSKEQQQILTASFQMSPKSNRMGVRFQANTCLQQILKLAKVDHLSKPVVYGTIQLTPSEEVIILMKEHQTIGGYPVLGNVMHTDLSRLSQYRPGQTLHLKTCTIEFAQQQKLSFYQKLTLSK